MLVQGGSIIRLVKMHEVNLVNITSEDVLFVMREDTKEDGQSDDVGG